MRIGLCAKFQLFLSDFIKTSIFVDKFWKNTLISNFMEIRPLVAELFHADGQTGMTKQMVAFRNITNAPKINLSSQMTTFTSNNRINAPRRAQKMRFVG
jgi:hypothetical protein